ncbi:hypothetical protein EV193_101702 [Herbihabitans rhizosphaerae]|uniref:Uncharacterized protein n=2 Tax=Herbihabitans rhizosphaerae TaxID=1872711 RepID=A0A4Q7L8T7_9PSEU|nr:hypothetical protein EV193_101702 [Herbihabitans rhizosphaerae]
MERQGFGSTTQHGYFLTPYAGQRRLGVVFTPDASLDGWFPEDAAGLDRLLPIAQVGGDGSVGALWLDDDGSTRVVGLGSEGEAFLLADSAVEFLTLVAIGYGELSPYVLGLPPDDADSVRAVGGFRTWVRDTFSVAVPDEWPAVGSDAFTTWVRTVLGEPEPPRPDEIVVDGPSAPVTGEITALVRALGCPDGGPEVGAVAAAAGVELSDGGVRWSGGVLRKVGLEVILDRGVVSTIFARVHEYPGRLVDGLPAAPSRTEITAALGEPERGGDSWVRYLVEGRYLHFQLDDSDRVTMITAMVEAP